MLHGEDSASSGMHSMIRLKWRLYADQSPTKEDQGASLWRWIRTHSSWSYVGNRAATLFTALTNRWWLFAAESIRCPKISFFDHSCGPGLNLVSSWFNWDNRGSTESIMDRICRAISFMSGILHGSRSRSFPAFKKTSGSVELQKPKEKKEKVDQSHFQVWSQAISYFSSSG